MPGGSCLLDSNMLLRIGKSDDPKHAAIGRAVRTLIVQGRAPGTPHPGDSI